MQSLWITLWMGISVYCSSLRHTSEAYRVRPGLAAYSAAEAAGL